MSEGLMTELNNTNDDINKLKYKITLLRKKLETLENILDEYILNESKEIISEIESNLYNELLYEEHNQKLNKLEENLIEITKYFKIINKIKYLNEHIDDFEKKDELLTWVQIMTDSLDSLNNNKLFLLDNQKENLELTYQTIYRLIKQEILCNGSSLLLSVINESIFHANYLKSIINKEATLICSSSYVTKKLLKNLKKILMMEKLNDIISENLIISILLITDNKKMMQTIEKKIETQKSSITSFQSDTKETLYNKLPSLIEEKKKLIKALNKKRKSLKKNIIWITILSTFMARSLFIINDTYKNDAKYETEITSYSLLRGYKREESLLEGLTDAAKIDDKDFKRILIVYNTYDLGIDYTSYDITGLPQDKINTYIDIDTSTLQDKIIQTARTDTNLGIEVKEMKQDKSEKIFDDVDGLNIAVNIVVAVLNTAVMLLYLNDVRKNLKEKNILTKELDDKIKMYEDLLSESSNNLNLNEKTLQELFLLIKELDLYMPSYEKIKENQAILRKKLNEQR